jgi:hypothetical protein
MRKEKTMQPAKTIKDAVSDALDRETHTSGLSPDQQTPMKPQETGDEGLKTEKNWPFPAPREMAE